ncbi:hypothetical protein F2Q70_00023142 [Brassica cretica]|nr:hypothetical protein F2Q70_00023142 [Brassica cretica]
MAIGPRTRQAQSLHSNRARTRLGRYVATKLRPRSVATYRPSSSQVRSLRSDRAPVKLGRYKGKGANPPMSKYLRSPREEPDLSREEPNELAILWSGPVTRSRLRAQEKSLQQLAKSVGLKSEEENQDKPA